MFEFVILMIDMVIYFTNQFDQLINDLKYR